MVGETFRLVGTGNERVLNLVLCDGGSGIGRVRSGCAATAVISLLRIRFRRQKYSGHLPPIATTDASVRGDVPRLRDARDRGEFARVIGRRSSQTTRPWKSRHDHNRETVIHFGFEIRTGPNTPVT